MPFHPNGTWYAYAEFDNGTLADMGAYSSQVSANAFGLGLLLLIYMAFMLAGNWGRDRDPVGVNAASAFVTWAASIFMVGMTSLNYGSWLPQEALYGTTFFLVVSVAILYLGRR